MNIQNFEDCKISENRRWVIKKKYTEHNPSDTYDSFIKHTNYFISKVDENGKSEELYYFSYEENYNKYADIQEYIGIRNFEFIENSLLYLESVEGDSDIIDLDNDDPQQISNRIKFLNGEIKLY